jgi:hypothetical protein
LTLKYERVAKIMKVATINPAITRIVRCSALGIVVRGPLIARRTGCGAPETANNAFYFDTRRDGAAAIANARKAPTIPAVLISPSGHSDHRCLSPILRVKQTLRRNPLEGNWRTWELPQLDLSNFIFVILFGICAEKQLYAGD